MKRSGFRFRPLSALCSAFSFPCRDARAAGLRLARFGIAPRRGLRAVVDAFRAWAGVRAAGFVEAGDGRPVISHSLRLPRYTLSFSGVTTSLSSCRMSSFTNSESCPRLIFGFCCKLPITEAATVRCPMWRSIFRGGSFDWTIGVSSLPDQICSCLLR